MPYCVVQPTYILLALSRTGIIIAAAIAGVIVAPIAAPPVLGIVGFGATGPVAGMPQTLIISCLILNLLVQVHLPPQPRPASAMS